jgi:hypothetical protein
MHHNGDFSRLCMEMQTVDKKLKDVLVVHKLRELASLVLSH